MAILISCRRLLLPIVRFLLRFGIGYREFSEVAKKAYVDVAAREFGVRGRKTNTSRIAILTGLPRKQVKRIGEYEGVGNMTESHMTQASLVLAAWHTDPRFSKGGNKPMDLAIDDGTPSFRELVKEYGRDVPTVAMLKELNRTGVIEKLRNGKIRAISRTNLAKGADLETVRRAGTVLNHMASTVTHNLISDDESDRRFERRAFTTKLDPQYFEEFRHFVSVEGQRFLERIDNWIALHEMQPDCQDPDPLVVGLGIYSFEGKET